MKRVQFYVVFLAVLCLAATPAMADLFGGFDTAFFDAYQGMWPLDPGWRERRRFYQLYHMLNHANLFGGGYVMQAQRMLAQLLAELR